MDKIKMFSWDPNKRKSNLEKHGIDFEDAKIIFEDPYRIESKSIRNGEERYSVIGEVNEIIFLVAYTYRDGDVIRIISARRASKDERNTYYEV